MRGLQENFGTTIQVESVNPFQIETQNYTDGGISSYDEPIETFCMEEVLEKNFTSITPYCMGDIRICMIYNLSLPNDQASPIFTGDNNKIIIKIQHYNLVLNEIIIPLSSDKFPLITQTSQEFNITIDFDGENDIDTYDFLNNVLNVNAGIFENTTLYGQMIYGSWNITIEQQINDVVFVMDKLCLFIYPKKECCPKAVTSSVVKSDVCLENGEILWLDFFFNKNCGKDLNCTTFENIDDIELYQLLSPGVISENKIDLNECIFYNSMSARSLNCNSNTPGCFQSTSLTLEDSSMDTFSCDLLHFQCPFNGHFNSPYEYLGFVVFKNSTLIDVSNIIKIKSECAQADTTVPSKSITVDRVFSDMTNIKFGDVITVTNIVCNNGCACLKEICIYDSWCGVQGQDLSAITIPQIQYIPPGECRNYSCNVVYSYKQQTTSSYRIDLSEITTSKRGYVLENIDNMDTQNSYNILKKEKLSKITKSVKNFDDINDDSQNDNTNEEVNSKIQQFYGYSIVQASTCVCDINILNTSLPIDCNDSNPCTKDYFDSQVGCINDPILDCCVVSTDCLLDHFLDPSVSNCFIGECVFDDPVAEGHQRPNGTGCCHYVPKKPDELDADSCCTMDSDCNQIISYCNVYKCLRGFCVFQEANNTACDDQYDCTNDLCNDHGECENIQQPYCTVGYCGNGIVEDGEDCEITSATNDYIYNSCCTEDCKFKPHGAICTLESNLSADNSYLTDSKDSDQPLHTNCYYKKQTLRCTGNSATCPMGNNCLFEFQSVFIN